jgi:hypothetical protein
MDSNRCGGGERRPLLPTTSEEDLVKLRLAIREFHRRERQRTLAVTVVACIVAIAVFSAFAAWWGV